MFILEQGGNGIGVGDRVSRPDAGRRILRHFQSVILIHLRSVQEERVLKSRVSQLAVVYVVRSLVVDQVLLKSQSNLLHVVGLRSIERIHTVGNFIGTNRQ